MCLDGAPRANPAWWFTFYDRLLSALDPVEDASGLLASAREISVSKDREQNLKILIRLRSSVAQRSLVRPSVESIATRSALRHHSLILFATSRF